MANTTDKPKFVPQFKPVVVKRNDVEWTFTPAQVKKGEDKDAEFLSPTEATNDMANTFLSWMGLDNWIKKAQSMVRTLAQNWWFEALDQATDKQTGKVDETKAYEVFNQLASEFSARGESIPQLKEQIQEFVEMMTELDPTADGAIEKITQYAQEIKKLNTTIQAKKRLTKAEKEQMAAEEKAAA
jgi:DNA repair ATPase RecN